MRILLVSITIIICSFHAAAQERFAEFPLIQAASQGDYQRVQQLLEAGHSPNQSAARGETALMEASRQGFTSVTELLLSRGASVNAKDQFGRTALTLAVQGGFYATAQSLQRYGADTSGLPPSTVRRINQPPSFQPATTRSSVPAKKSSTGKILLIGGGVAVLAVGGGVAGWLIYNNTQNNNDDVTNGPVTLTLPDPPINLDPGLFETDEYRGTGTLAQINASAAYARGYTGSGVTVAVLDTGVDLTHQELDGVFLGGGKDFVRDDDDPDSEQLGHGTQVSGIVAAKKNNSQLHGVAYDSRILPLKVFGRSGSGRTLITGVDDAIAYTTAQNIPILNNSWGLSAITHNITTITSEFDLATRIGSNTLRNLKEAAKNKQILVFSTGNQGSDNPSPEAAAPLFFTGNDKKLGELWIAVAAVNSSNELLGNSNRCGKAMHWCLVAPGIGTSATDPSSNGSALEYSPVAGTSFAAPHVAGAAAILKSAFPHLTHEQIIDILLKTAKDLGAVGVDAQFGHGLLDLEAATRPGDITVVPLSQELSGSSAPLETSRIEAPSATGDALLASQNSLQFFDQWQRGFDLGFSRLTTTKTRLHAEDHLTLFGPKASNIIDLGNGESFSLTHHPATSRSSAYDSASLRLRFGDHHLDSIYHTPAAYAWQSTLMPELHFANGYHPFLNHMGKSVGSVIGLQLMENTQARLASFYGSQAWHDLEHAQEEHIFAALWDIAYTPDQGLAFGFEQGVLVEENTLLGGRFEGAFAIGEQNTSYFTSFHTRYQFENGLAFFGASHLGLTMANLVNESLITDIEPLITTAFSAGGEFSLGKHHMRLAATQPLRVESGQLDLKLPTSANQYGQLSFDQHRLSLTPSNREFDLQGLYTTALGFGEIQLGTTMRLWAEHQQEINPELLGMVRFRGRF